MAMDGENQEVLVCTHTQRQGEKGPTQRKITQDTPIAKTVQDTNSIDLQNPCTCEVRGKKETIPARTESIKEHHIHRKTLRGQLVEKQDLE